jgi:hypothetical protein
MLKESLREAERPWIGAFCEWSGKRNPSGLLERGASLLGHENEKNNIALAVKHRGWQLASMAATTPVTSPPAAERRPMKGQAPLPGDRCNDPGAPILQQHVDESLSLAASSGTRPRSRSVRWLGSTCQYQALACVVLLLYACDRGPRCQLRQHIAGEGRRAHPLAATLQRQGKAKQAGTGTGRNSKPTTATNASFSDITAYHHPANGAETLGKQAI